MPDIMLILSCLSQHIDKTNLGRLGCLVEGLLAMTGRVTMLGLSRWTARGGSYRTLQRWFNTTLNWGPAALAADSPSLAGRGNAVVTGGR